MDERSREMLIQMLLRNIRQMYYSRAYCEPKLQRFMIRAPPPQPTPPPPPPAPATPPPPYEPKAPLQSAAKETSTAAMKAEVGRIAMLLLFRHLTNCYICRLSYIHEVVLVMNST